MEIEKIAIAGVAWLLAVFAEKYSLWKERISGPNDTQIKGRWGGRIWAC